MAQGWEAEYQFMLGELKKMSEQLGIANLKDSPDDSNEIRLCVGFGLTYPRCFIFRKISEKHQALYYGPRYTGGKAAVDSHRKVILSGKELPIPRSGWEAFERFLQQNRIEFALPLKLDKKRGHNPDEQFIALETKSTSGYSMVFYSLDGDSKDARTVLDFCRKVEEEFDTIMDCGDR
jgi:hypothetical protein